MANSMSTFPELDAIDATRQSKFPELDAIDQARKTQPFPELDAIDSARQSAFPELDSIDQARTNTPPTWAEQPRPGLQGQPQIAGVTQTPQAVNTAPVPETMAERMTREDQARAAAAPVLTSREEMAQRVITPDQEHQAALQGVAAGKVSPWMINAPLEAATRGLEAVAPTAGITQTARGIMTAEQNLGTEAARAVVTGPWGKAVNAIIQTVAPDSEYARRLNLTMEAQKKGILTQNRIPLISDVLDIGAMGPPAVFSTPIGAAVLPVLTAAGQAADAIAGVEGAFNPEELASSVVMAGILRSGGGIPAALRERLALSGGGVAARVGKALIPTAVMSGEMAGIKPIVQGSAALANGDYDEFKRVWREFPQEWGNTMAAFVMIGILPLAKAGLAGEIETQLRKYDLAPDEARKWANTIAYNPLNVDVLKADLGQKWAASMDDAKMETLARRILERTNPEQAMTEQQRVAAMSRGEIPFEPTIKTGGQNAINQGEIEKGGVGEYSGIDVNGPPAETGGGNRVEPGGIIPQAQEVIPGGGGGTAIGQVGGITGPPVEIPAIEEQGGADKLGPWHLVDRTKALVQNVPADQIAVRPELMQFKDFELGTGGVVGKRRLKGPWDEFKSGLLLLWEPINPAKYGLQDGEKYIAANGHYRINLGQREGVSKYNVQVIREADGFSVTHARILAAEINIADGKGTIYDQVNLLRAIQEAYSKDEAVAAGIRTGQSGRKAATIAFNAAPRADRPTDSDLIDAFVNERITPDQAEVIADVAPNDAGWQAVGIKSAVRKMPPEELRNFLNAAQRLARASAIPKNIQGDLFGNVNDRAYQQAIAQGKAAEEIKKGIRVELDVVRAGKRASGEKRAEIARKYGISVDDPAALQAIADKLGQELERWAKWAENEDLVAQVYAKLGQSIPPAPETIPALIEPRRNLGELIPGGEMPFNLYGEKAVSDAEAIRLQREEARRVEEAKQNKLNDMARELPGMADKNIPTLSKATLPRQIDTSIPIPEISATEPISEADIRRYISKALDIPVRVGIRAPGAAQGALGIFRTRPETIRLKLLNDLPALSHEVGHYLHYILLGEQPVEPGQSYNRFAGQFDNELIPLGNKTSKPSYTPAQVQREGVAEFTRLYLTDPAKAIAAAPKFAAYWKTTLEEKYQEINDILNNAQKQIGEYIRQPAMAKVKSMIVSSDQARPRKTIRDILNNAYDDWINQLGPIERTMDWLVKMGLPPEQAQMVKGLANNFIGGWRGKVEFALHQAAVDLNMKNVGPSLKEILAKAPNMDDLRAFLIAKRSVELNERGKTTGIDTADAKQVIRELEIKYEPIRWELRQFQVQQLKLLIDSGILSKEEAVTMEFMNVMYVPFYRLYEGIGGAGGPRTGGGDGFVNVGKGVRRFKGSDRQIIDPLESIIRNAYVFRELAERNKIGSAFIKAVEQVQGGGRVGETVTKPIKAVPINTEEIAQIVAKSGLAEEIAKQWGIPVDTKWVNEYLADKKVVAKVWRAVSAMQPKDGIFRVWQNGEEKDFQVGDPELLRSLTLADATDAAMMNKWPLVKWFKLATAIKRAGSTLTFEFMGRNPFRDQITAGIYSKYGYIPFVDMFHTLFSVLKRDDLYWDWVKNGGRYSDFIAADRTDLRQTLESVIKDPNVLQQALSWINPVNVLQNLQKLSEVMELTTRIGEYRRGIAVGATSMEAANASKEVTLNFGRHGFSGAVVNRVVAFFNAGVQDPARMVREWKTRPKQMLLKNLLGITGISLLLWWWNKDDEVINKLPGYRRTLFWNINVTRLINYLHANAPADILAKIPIVITGLLRRPGISKVGETYILSLPKPFLEGILFGSSAEMALDLVYKKDKHAVRDWFQAIESQIPNPFAWDLTRPTIEVMANYDFFKSQQIVNSGLQRLPAEFQTRPETSILATKVGQRIGVSPLMIEHWIRGHFAGLTQYGLDLADIVLMHGLALDVPPAPAKRISDLPLLRGFRVSPYAPSKYVDQFYSGSQAAEERIAALRNPLTGFKAVKTHWFKQNKMATLWYLAPDHGKPRITSIRKIQEGMNNQTRAMSLIQQSMNMDPETKRQKLIEIKDQRDAAAKAALMMYIFPDDR